MKTLQEIKDEYARELGYSKWDQVSFNSNYSHRYDEIAKRYAKQYIKPGSCDINIKQSNITEKKKKLKEQYALCKGFKSWNIAMDSLGEPSFSSNSDIINEFIDGYQELCCNEVAKASLEKAADNAESYFDTDEESHVDKSTITSPDNIVLL